MEAKDIVKWSIMGFLTLYLLTGLSLIIFAVTVPTPFGDYLTMKGAAFPISYVIRIIFLLLILIITALCFYAVAKENNQLLTVFAVLLIILFLVEFIIAIIYFTLTSEINLNEDKFSNGMQMMAAYGMDKKITEAFDRIQRTYACCGLTDYRDWFTSKWDAAQVCCLVYSSTSFPGTRFLFFVLLCAFTDKRRSQLIQKSKTTVLLSRWGIACVQTSPPLSHIFLGGGGGAFVDRLVNLFTRVNDDLIHSVDKTPFCT